MRAVVKRSRSPRDVVVTDVPQPAPAPGEVLVRAEAVGLCGSDVHAWKQDSGYEWVTSPVVLGHEAVGVVEAVAGDVDPAWIGRRIVPISIDGCGSCQVCAADRRHICPDRRVLGLSFDGAAADYFTIGVERLVAVPPDVPADALVLTEPLAIAAHAVEQLNRSADGRAREIVVTGPGPIGIMAAMLLDRYGHRVTLVGVARDEPVRLSTAAGLGLRTSHADDIGHKPSLWLEASGSGAALDRALKDIAVGGTVVVPAMFSRIPSFNINTVTRHELRILGSYGATRADYQHAAAAIEKDPDRWLRLTTSFPLPQGIAALHAIERGAVVKAILIP